LREAALDVFLKHGFAGTTMEAVARAAGITKRTLYARYADKNALFSDAIVWALAQYHAPELPQAIEEWDLAEGLLEIARQTLVRARNPSVKRLNRLAFLEAARIPSFSTKAFSTVWSPRVGAVARLLNAHLRAGAIVLEDVETAAEQFIGMATQGPMWLTALGQDRPPELEDRYLRHAVELFVRSLQPRLNTHRLKMVHR
jgi:AcrR family transcriptional regulator